MLASPGDLVVISQNNFIEYSFPEERRVILCLLVIFGHTGMI